MPRELMPSQQQAYEQLVSKLSHPGRRQKFLLLGRSQTGKSYLLQYMAEEKGYRYINFTREILPAFVGKRWLDSLNFQVLEEILRDKVERESGGTTAVIDEVDSAIMLLTSGDKPFRSIFTKQFLSMDHSTPYIISTSLFPEEEMNKLAGDNPQQIVVLGFTQQDKIFVKERFFNNVGLFNMAETNNIRQMFKQ